MSRDHYVSKGILKQFRFNETQVHYLRKGYGIEEKNPRSIFCKSNLNPKHLEDYLSNKFDDKIVKIIDSVRECIEKRGWLSIGVDVHEWLTDFMTVQLRRDPGFLPRDDFVDRTKNLVAGAIAADAASGAEIDPDDIYLTFQEIDRDADHWIAGLRITELPMVYNFLRGRRFVFATARDANSEFIVGSRPVVFVEDGPGRPSDPFRKIWMPIAPDLALGSLAPYEAGPIVTLPEGYIDQINQAIFTRSDAVASRRRDLLEALVASQQA